MAADIPVACTLSPGDYRERLATIATLSRDALRHVERHGSTLELRYAPEAAARVQAMVDQERRCCAFLVLDLERRPDHLCLRVTVPDGAAEAVPDLLFELTGRQS